MKAIRRILVPIDFSDCSRDALRYATDLGKRLRAAVHVLHVYQEPAYLTADLMLAASPRGRSQSVLDYVRDGAQGDLDSFLRQAAKEGVDWVQGRLERGDPYREILRVAEEGPYDLIVMGTHGRRGVSRWILGSVAERVLRHAPCPVVTVPPKKRAGVARERLRQAA